MKGEKEVGKKPDEWFRQAEVNKEGQVLQSYISYPLHPFPFTLRWMD